MSSEQVGAAGKMNSAARGSAAAGADEAQASCWVPSTSTWATTSPCSCWCDVPGWTGRERRDQPGP